MKADQQSRHEPHIETLAEIGVVYHAVDEHGCDAGRKADRVGSPFEVRCARSIDSLDQQSDEEHY